MAPDTKQILQDALKLSAIERANLADQPLSSLDRPDENIDARWRKEAEDRLNAYRAGKLKGIPLKEVLAKYNK